MEVKKKSMIVADDIEMMRSVLKKIFSKDYDVYEAESGVEVFEIMAKQKIDVILLDIIMPDMDGLETLEKLRNDDRYNNVAVLVATSTKEKTERKALYLGADDIISKPYDPVVVRKRVENIVERRNLIQTVHLLISEEDMQIQEKFFNELQCMILGAYDKVDTALARVQKNGGDAYTEETLKRIMQEFKQLSIKLKEL